MTKIVIDPIARGEGQMKVEAVVENGVVKKAKSSGMMYRGLENILIDRDLRDAARIVRRLCWRRPGEPGNLAAPRLLLRLLGFTAQQCGTTHSG